MTVARYSYYPWLRRGISNEIQTSAAGSPRAALDVTLNVASDVAATAVPPRQVQLVGPGDVIGINPRVVVRTEPRHWITDFEPNFLTFVEFYDEDFPWRYTPASPDAALHRLTPWITLLVLEEGEFTRNDSPARPLPSVSLNGVAAGEVLPPDSQLYAWAHVHVNAAAGMDHSPDLPSLSALLRNDPDRAYSRLMSARRLKANTGYSAFVIPTFEVGRKAGLGEALAETEPGLALAWAVATEFPVYYEWFFRTGVAGDFEELVRSLKPRAIDKRVGIRDLDVQQPGFLMPPVTSPPDDVVGLEGALLSPFSEPKPLAASSNFPPEIARVVNLATDLEQTGVTAGDPVVSAPLYGRWHALVQRMSVDPAQRNWVNELNVDPRYRAVAGFGTRVVQAGQEEYMRLAWQQIGEILAANRRIHFAQMAIKSSQAAFVKNLKPLPVASALAITKPVHAKVMASPTTVAHLVKGSRLPAAALSGAFRKQLRPRGPIARRAFSDGTETRPHAAAVGRLNEGAVSAAPPRGPTRQPTLESFADRQAESVGIIRLLAANRLLALIAAIVIALLSMVLGPFPLGTLAGLLASVAAWLGYGHLGRIAERISAGEVLRVRAFTRAVVRQVPAQPTFVLSPPDRPDSVDRPPSGLRADSPDAADFREALVDLHELVELRIEPLERPPPLALAVISRTVLNAVEPTVAFPRRMGAILKVGGLDIGRFVGEHYRDDVAASAERIVPVMAYPDIRKPMYEPLRDISSDLLVPNLRLIEPNTISLMVRNQPFVEAYIVGLNHEFARELLWREYPTDQRPSTFRQFWDVSTVANVDNLPPRDFEESLRDVKPLHEWTSTSRLGDHDNRRRATDPHDDASTELLRRPVVLVIRGDLLKRYPNTIVYAQRAKWGKGPGDNLRLVLWDETGEGAAANAADPNVRLPLFKASVPPDIHFVGFNLTVEDVKGAPDLEETVDAKGRIPAEKLGWFFVVQEVAGEPRFGLDENPPEADSPSRWDNLSWDHLGQDVKVVDVDRPFLLPITGNDEGIRWGANSADMASILFQRPVLVAIHAREMLAGLA